MSELLSTEEPALGLEDAELDMAKTKENIWGLLTMQGDYDSVLQFIDESIPKLKRRQQEDMRETVKARIGDIRQLIVKVVTKDALQEM